MSPCRGWMLNAAAYWAKGENRDTDQALNSIAPPQAVIGLSWVSASDSWDFTATGTFTGSKDESDIDDTDGERFATPSWVIVDLTAGWRPNQRVELRAGIFNATDKKYWRWLDVANMDSSDPMISPVIPAGTEFLGHGPFVILSHILIIHNIYKDKDPVCRLVWLT